MAPGDTLYKDYVNVPFDAEQEIPVSQILDERTTPSGNREMLPKWQGYELDPNGWQPASSFNNTAALQVGFDDSHDARGACNCSRICNESWLRHVQTHQLDSFCTRLSYPEKGS